MDVSVVNRDLLFQLIHERNLIVVRNISELTIKDKRRVLAILRQVPQAHPNLLLPRFSGVTIGEFCTVQLLMSESKRKFKEYVHKQCTDMNLGLFDNYIS